MLNKIFSQYFYNFNFEKKKRFKATDIFYSIVKTCIDNISAFMALSLKLVVLFQFPGQNN